MVYAIIPAAGIGSRMQSTIPKQYLPLLHGTVLLYSIRALLKIPEIRLVMIALHPDDRWWPQTEKLLGAEERMRVKTCTGGAERWQSVLAALTAITDYIGDRQSQDPGNDSWVMVHDAVRPCVRSADLYRLLHSCLNHTRDSAGSDAGALLAVPVSDTIKKSDSSHTVVTTIDRSQLWAACTPQMFSIVALQRALTSAAAAGIPVTDEASAIEYYGGHPLLVPCARDNIKITYPDDLQLAALILQAAIQRSEV